MVELVIKIPMELYDLIQNKSDFNGDLKHKDVKVIILAVDDGTPLPKGHGRLIDADAIINTLGCSDRDIYVKACIEEDAPTIIEADRAESEGEE